MFEILYGFSVAFNIFLCICCYYLASEIQSYKYIIRKASEVLEKDIEKMVKEDKMDDLISGNDTIESKNKEE